MAMEITEEIDTRHTAEKDPWKEDDSNSVSAQESFSYCDVENKGYITRIDMERLCNIVPFNKYQVEQMFESMDKGKNGEITLQEFISGFDALIEVSSSPDFRRFKKRSHSNGRALSPIEEMSYDPHEEFLEETDDGDILETDGRLRKILDDLKTEYPSLIPEFEQLFAKIASEIEISDVHLNNLELSLQTCSNWQDRQLEQLYEILEWRIGEEKAKAIAQEKAKNDKINRRLQEELQMKEFLLNEIKLQQEEMGKKISGLISEEKEIKRKNRVLLKERNELERKVTSTEKMLEEIEVEIKGISEDALQTKKRREQSWYSRSREISLEEELLAARADNLRRQNKWLLDECDAKTFPHCAPHDNGTFRGSRSDEINVSNDGDNVLEAVEEVHRTEGSLSHYIFNNERIPLQMRSMHRRTDDPVENQYSSSENSSISSALDYIGITDEYEKPLPPSSTATWKVTCSFLPQDTAEQKAYWKVKLKVVPFREKMIIYPQIMDNDFHRPLSPDVCDGLTTPERIFKIILVGDSGVGKTSFIQRFCNDSFRTSFQSTIGIDFQVKSIVVNNRCISLQLWDTAGQERFRCISKQYFRKSDAVIVMYDVMSEQTFKNIRQWITHIKENAEDGAIILLLGNKIDARDADQQSIVSRSHGARLAQEYGALFFETSAKSGSNINEAMVELSSLLQEKEDLDMDKALVLEETSQKKKWRC